MQIPVTYFHNNIEYTGYLSKVSGGDGWHLMIDNYFIGQLILNAKGEWSFYNQKNDMNYLAEEFGMVVTSYYQ